VKPQGQSAKPKQAFKGPAAAKQSQRPRAENSDEEILSDDDEEIPSDEDEEIPSDEIMSSSESEDTPSASTVDPCNKHAKGYNRYGTEDAILAAAEDALDNGLFDSEGNLDEAGFEGLFGSKFASEDDTNEEDEEEDLSHDEEEEEFLEEDSASEEEDSVSSEEEATNKVTRLPSKGSFTASAAPVASVQLTQQQLQPQQPQTEDYLALTKKVKGLLNRLSMGNFESIAVSLEALYKEHPRRTLTQLLTDLILTAITTQANLLDSFVLVFASLVGTLAHLAGMDFAAHLLQRLVELFLESNAKCGLGIIAEASTTPSPERTVMNLFTFLAFLYDLQIVSNRLIGDIVQEAVLRLAELDTEVILKAVRQCGAQFRRDDPATLKNIILALNERVAKIPAEQQSSRFRFMLESILDLKNNKLRATSGGPQTELEATKKLLRNLAQQRGIAKFEPLRFGLEDIRKAGTNGRWWLVGGTWAPEAAQEKLRSRAQEKLVDGSAKESDKIASLAKEQRMNTELRRTIFSAIVASEDCIDAFQRLVSLKLTSRQERDIPAVLLQCCAQEKAYNPFYALLALRCISFRHNHLITFKYAFWDWLQQVQDSPLRKISHLATFYATLLSERALPLAILKKADFLHLSEKEALFFQLIMAKLLLQAPQEVLSGIFEELSVRRKRMTKRDEEEADEMHDQKGAAEDNTTLKASLKLFLTFYLKNSTELPPFVKDPSILTARIDAVLPCLA